MHKYLSNNLGWYSKWHKESRYSLLHWLLFIIIAVALVNGISKRIDPKVSLNLGMAATNKAVLTPQDFEYLGALRVPNGADTTYGRGGLAGRQVNGKTHLFVVGGRPSGWPVTEIVDPGGGYNADMSKAPVAAVYANWGTPFGSVISSFNKDGSRIGAGQFDVLNALFFNENTGLLYSTYYQSYAQGVLSDTGADWSIVGAGRNGATGVITPYGPWRLNVGGSIGHKLGQLLAQHPVDGSMMAGGTTDPAISSVPWGPTLHGGGQWPTTSTPKGFGSPNINIPDKYIRHYWSVGDIAQNGTLLPGHTLKSFRFKNANYIWNENNPPIDLNPQASENNGDGSWTEMSAIGGVIWLELLTKHGVLFSAGTPGHPEASIHNCRGHVWYATNAGGQLWRDSYGCDSPLGGTSGGTTGPVATDIQPWWIIYNPDDLMKVKNGQVTDYNVPPVASFNPKVAIGQFTSGYPWIMGSEAPGGFYFDSTRNYLFMAWGQVDDTIQGKLSTIIHVFHIKDGTTTPPPPTPSPTPSPSPTPTPTPTSTPPPNTCWGGMICGGIPVTGTPDQVVCGTDLKNWQCTPSGWKSIGTSCVCGVPPPTITLKAISEATSSIISGKAILLSSSKTLVKEYSLSFINGSASLTLDATGSFLKLVIPGYIAKLLPVTSATSYDFGTILAGDLNADNKVNTLDFAILKSVFGQTTTHPSDFNLDGKVNTIDYSYLKRNFGKMGEE